MLGLGLGASALGPPLHAEEIDHELARKALKKGKVLPLRSVLDKGEREYQGQLPKISARGLGQRGVGETKITVRVHSSGAVMRRRKMK